MNNAYTTSHDLAPIKSLYDRLRVAFGFTAVDWDKGTIIAYKDTVYSKDPIPADWLIHEQKHLEQQESYRLALREPNEPGANMAWWDRYIKDKEFRLSQELEACKAQVAWILENVHDRSARPQMFSFIMKTISSRQYGSMISYDKAYEALFPIKEVRHGGLGGIVEPEPKKPGARRKPDDKPKGVRLASRKFSRPKPKK